MSKVRYFISITLAVLGLAGCIALSIHFSQGTTPDEALICILGGIIGGYVVGSILGELVFWNEGVAVRAFLKMLSVAKMIFVFWLSFFFDGRGSQIILGLILTTPFFTAMGIMLEVAFVPLVFLSPFTFIYHLVVFGKDLY